MAKRKLNARQLRWLFATGKLRASGKGKDRKVTYSKEGQAPKRAAIGGSKAAGLRSGSGKRDFSATRAERIKAGRKRGVEWQASAKGQGTLRGLGAAKREGDTLKDTARRYNAARKSGDHSATRAARIAAGRSKAADFIARDSASRLGAYKMSTDLLGMSRKDAARMSGVDRIGGRKRARDKKAYEAQRQREKAQAAAAAPRAARIAAGREAFARFSARRDLTGHQRAGVSAGKTTYAASSTRFDRGKAISEFRQGAAQRGKARRANNQDAQIRAGRTGRMPSDFNSALKVFNGLKAEGGNTSVAHRRLMRLIRAGRV